MGTWYKLDGQVKGVFVKYVETIVDATGTRTIDTESQSFSRNTVNPVAEKIENLYVSFEIDAQKQSAGIAYYVGFRLHPSCLTIGG